MRTILFYKNSSGHEPVKEYILDLKTKKTPAREIQQALREIEYLKKEEIHE